MIKTKVKEIWKEHKKGILIGTGLTVLSGVVYVITKKSHKFDVTDIGENIMSNINYVSLEEQARIDAFGCNVGTVTGMWNEGKYLNFIVNDIKAKDIGDLGKEFLRLNEITEDTMFSLVVSTWDN